MSRRAAVAALALALATAGCGVPTDSEARTLGTPPFGLLTSSTTVPATTVPPEEGFRLTLYWVTADDQVVPGEPIGLPRAPTFQEVVDLLTEGPPMDGSGGTTSTTRRPGTQGTSGSSLRTYVTEGLNPEGDEGSEAVGPVVLEVQGGVLDLLVADRFREESQATPTRFRLAIAQVVCTVTQFDNVDGVRFFDSRGQLSLVNLEQNPIEVGTRDNIGRCDPPAASRTTTTSASTPRPPAAGG